MMLFYKRGQLAEQAKSPYHAHGRKQYGQLEHNRYPGRQREMWFAADVQRPAFCKYPADKRKRYRGARNAVYKTSRMQAGIAQAHRTVQPVNREGRVYIMH